VKDGRLYVIEVNPRASRTVPFLSKASGVNLVAAAVHVWNGGRLTDLGICGGSRAIGIGSPRQNWAVKEAVFSFDRFDSIDPVLGPEMRSTGEVMGCGETLGEAFAKAQLSAGSSLPTEGNVFVSVHKKDRDAIIPVVRELEELGFRILATRGTANFLFENGIFADVVQKVSEGRPNMIDYMRYGKVRALINTPLGSFSRHDDRQLRIEAVRQRIPYTTTTTAAWATVQGIRYLRRRELRIDPLDRFVLRSG
jgi:carbamoyl-phosphate synthase large subunit